MLFRRNLLKALEVYATPEFGLVDGLRSLIPDDLRGSLQLSYTAESRSPSEGQRAAQFKAKGSGDPDAVITTIGAQGRDR